MFISGKNKKRLKCMPEKRKRIPGTAIEKEESNRTTAVPAEPGPHGLRSCPLVIGTSCHTQKRSYDVAVDSVSKIQNCYIPWHVCTVVRVFFFTFLFAPS